MLGCHANLNVISAARCLYGHAWCQFVIIRATVTTCRDSSTSTRRSLGHGQLHGCTVHRPWAWRSSWRCTPFGRSRYWTRASNNDGRLGTPGLPLALTLAPVLCLCRSLQGEMEIRSLRPCLLPFFFKMNMVALSFVFDKYCLVMD
jgi:hypothetical protein